jgi:hypothetical protein
MTDEGTLLCDEENKCYPVAEASGVSSCLNGMPQGVPLPGVLIHGACGLITIRPQLGVTIFKALFRGSRSPAVSGLRKIYPNWRRGTTHVFAYDSTIDFEQCKRSGRLRDAIGEIGCNVRSIV